MNYCMSYLIWINNGQIFDSILVFLSVMKAKKKTTTEIICQNFNLPNQTIFQDYKCTLKAGIPFFGRLYIGEQHLMFASNMFGIVKKAAIVIDDITKVTELSNDTISITGKEYKTAKKDQDQFIISGFKNSNAFKLIYALWKKEILSSDVLRAPNEEESQSGQKMIEGRNLDQGNMEINFFNPQIVDTERQKMVELVLPCSLEQFYKFFIADDAEVYPRKKHLQFKKATNIVTGPWKRSQQMDADMRQITATIKVRGVPFKSQAGMTQVWLLTKRTPQQMTIKTTTQMADVPYCAYFTCEEHITIEKEGQTKCKFTCYSAVVFNKSTYMKNTILTKTFADLKEDYMQWTENVKQLLQKMKKSNNCGNDQRKSKKVYNVQFESENVHSPKKGQCEQVKVQQLGSASAFERKLNALNLKINLLIILVIFLAVLMVGNIFVVLQSGKRTPIETTQQQNLL